MYRKFNSLMLTPCYLNVNKLLRMTILFFSGSSWRTKCGLYWAGLFNWRIAV